MIVPVDTRAIAEIWYGYSKACDAEDKRIEKELAEEKAKKEHDKIMAEIKKRNDEEDYWNHLLMFGTDEEIEEYMHRTWMFEHYDNDRLCTFNPYSDDKKWYIYNIGYSD